jgi:nicotinamidase-related amidase
MVEATAMDAADLGYRVIVPEDCSASITAEMHLVCHRKSASRHRHHTHGR